ncbi:MAG: glucose 1-dehydrogenase [Burkholderiales bacterium]|nr:glucose 1-dehydrogenase [Burkholderiales bacterium]
MARHDFSDKVALVTGAGGGIGRAACIEFARAGAALACVDVDAARAQATAAAVRDLGGRAIALVADVTDAAAVERYVADTLVAFGRIDAFANNAGYQGRLLPLVDYPDDEFDRVIAINLRGAYLGLKHVLRVMLRQGSGAVVNTGSIGSFIGYGGLCAYAASKHALIGLSKSAALSVAKTGIRVNTVCPGGTETEMIRAIEAALPRDEAARMISAIPDGRRAWPEEIARTILFLASDDASHITGQSLVIDGGRLAG